MNRYGRATSIALVALVLGSCTLGCGDRKGAHARGSLKFDAQKLNDQLTTADAIEAFLETELTVISSRRNLERVVDNLRLHEKYDTTEEQAVSRLQKTVEVRRVKGALVLEVFVFDEDFEAASNACNEILRAYIEERRHERTRPDFEKEEWLSRQIEKLREELRVDGGPPDWVAEKKQQLDRLVAEATDAGLRARSSESDVVVLDYCVPTR